MGMAMEHEPQIRQDPVTGMWYLIPVIDKEETEEEPELVAVVKAHKKSGKK